jgi:LPS sulfotransferase NodH
MSGGEGMAGKWPEVDAKVHGRQFVFVVGAPRSGTTWLHKMIAAHPAVASVPHELTLFSKYLAPAVQRFNEEQAARDQGRWQQGLPVLFTPEEFQAFLLGVVATVYGRVLEQNPAATHIIDKHPHYAGHLPLIDRLVPGCKVVHIVRDGRDAVLSTLGTKRRVGFGVNRIEHAAHIWRERVRKARRDGSALGGDRYLELHYETAVNDPVAALRRVFGFLGLSASDAEVHGIASAFAMEKRPLSFTAKRAVSTGDWKGAMRLRDRYVMDRLAGGLLCELGYARPGWWASSPLDRLRMWLWTAGRRMAAAIEGARRPFDHRRA